MSEHVVYSADHSATTSLPGLEPTLPRPSPFGRRAFIAGSAGVAAATLVGSTAHAAVPSGASYFESIDPVRLADTRLYAPYTNVAKDFIRVNDRTIRIKIRGSQVAVVPSDAIAVVVSIGGLYNGSRGWVAALPTGSSTLNSNINMSGDDGAVANMATVKIGNGGQIDIKCLHPYDVIVDILGVYRPTSVAVKPGRMKFLPTTTRMLEDTRMLPNTWRTVPVSGVPRSAQAVVVNLTVSGCLTRGFMTAVGTRTAKTPTVSNLNYVVGNVRAAGAIVKLDGRANPAIEIYASGDVRAFVDVTGYITGESDAGGPSEEGLFVPIDPLRVMDTRRKSDYAVTGKKRLWPYWSRSFQLPQSTNGFGQRSQMGGVVFNATLAGAMGRGYVTVLAAQTPKPYVSNLNATRVDQTVANHVISRVSTAGVEIFSRGGGDVVADVAGWFTGAPQAATQPVTVDPAAPAAPFNWLLTVNRMGLQNWVAPNVFSGDPVVDAGNTWHWTGTGFLGNDGASIVTFGHRRSHGAPFYYQHHLQAGDEMILDSPDQRRYRYRFVKETITNSSPTQILNASRGNAAGTTFTLVSCTGTGSAANDQPLGGISFRLVSTFALLGWTDERAQSAD